ncbi:NUDIX domain-containing protein [Treponema socranskii]|uniref:NUDIX domain-containing protein n=1 Tax=Treponema socranskii TaxID=53419 RepID=UPI003616F874
MEKIIQKIIENYLFLLAAFALVYFNQKRVGFVSVKKRRAVFIMLMLAVFYLAFLLLIQRMHWNSYFAIPGFIAVVFTGFLLRRHTWPFKSRCQKCGKRLTITQMLTNDENICGACFVAEHPELAPKTEADIQKEFDDEWTAWKPGEYVVLCFIVNERNQVLLIDRKYIEKGSGKVSGAMSRMEAGEDPVAACKRCALEETGLAVEEPRCHGRLNFALPGRDLRCYVFIADEFAGTIKETDKNLPYWVNSKKLPFGKMSVDGRVWLPIALDRGYFDYYGTCNEKGYVVKDTLRRQLPKEPFA